MMRQVSNSTEAAKGLSDEEQGLRAACQAVLDAWLRENPEDEREPRDIDDTIFEAQVLLVCEEIHRGNMTDRRIQRAVLDIRLGKHEDILDLVRLRFFEREAYLARLRSVGTVFDQLVKGEMNRTVMRPAKYTPKQANIKDE